ncbi:molecular chaperone DnaK suppressor DksA [Halarcobacter mediterraneus]|uniref:Molecular chaperone DnaK suppressor DksA n=1 Tax=Halarcobacter mediterraneus TaxID=2023153 RepID=A0A4Q1AV89_9BACT|nr:RNA polymerase-binding protein DksA [Halarcobacter mediterraneus]RXK12812.1 molecular chaperone DnaK suppressor DksA [Halarcobacter mediterraneus]
MGRELNKKQIEEIKELLLKNKAIIEGNLNNLSNEHVNLSEMDLNDEGDFAAASRDYSTDIHIKKQQLEELRLIDHALRKIYSGKFTGLCEMCDSEITMKRLRVKPHAMYCIDCRNYLENEKQIKKAV